MEDNVIAKLYEWRKHVCKKDGTYVIWGFVYDDRELRFPDGHWIHTSAVDYIEGDVAVMRTGNRYLLVGEPSGPPVTLVFHSEDQEQKLLKE